MVWNLRSEESLPNYVYVCNTPASKETAELKPQRPKAAAYPEGIFRGKVGSTIRLLDLGCTVAQSP